MKKVEKTIEYYKVKSDHIISIINSSSGLTADQIIDFGEQLAILEYKMTALEIALED